MSVGELAALLVKVALPLQIEGTRLHGVVGRVCEQHRHLMCVACMH